METTEHVEHYYGSLAGMLKKYDKAARGDAFAGQTQAQFEAWRTASRNTLQTLLGMQYMERCEATPQRMAQDVELPEGIVREKWRIQVEPDTWMTFYVLTPKRPAQESRCFLCPPGHQGGGKESVAGRREIPAIHKMIDYYGYDYGLQLARRGHTAICPDCRGFGERRDEALQNDEEASYLNSTCFHLAHMAEPMGETVAGMCTWDLMRLIDWAAQTGRWDMTKLSCLGFSGGGMQTLWLAALDDRVHLAVISGYLYGYRDSLLTLNGNCSCNYVPGLWRHFDMGDIASLIAPRPLVVQSCSGDHLNGPRGLANVTEQLEIVRAAYGLYDAENRLYHDVCEGEHHWHEEHIDKALSSVLQAQ